LNNRSNQLKQPHNVGANQIQAHSNQLNQGVMFHNQVHEPEQEADLIDQNAEEVNAHHRHDRNLEDDPFAQIKEYGTQDDELQNSLTVADAKSEAASLLDKKDDVKMDAPENVIDDERRNQRRHSKSTTSSAYSYSRNTQ